ncbi:MAG: hypothetical protein WBB19_11225 [Desulforhopalus sp.]
MLTVHDAIIEIEKTYGEGLVEISGPHELEPKDIERATRLEGFDCSPFDHCYDFKEEHVAFYPIRIGGYLKASY